MQAIKWMLLAAIFTLAASDSHTERELINGHKGPSKEERDPQFWRVKAKEELNIALGRKENKNKAKNVILFLGDGMSISTIFGARVYKGQKKGNPGEEEKMVFENFPNVALSKTYSVDHQISDSAVTATAYHCGVKANYATIGVDASATLGTCKGSKEAKLSCIADMSIAEGKDAGFVTTARITHASPAPTYVWTADRKWEDDSYLTDEAKENGCPDMAAQLIMEKANNLKVMMGGGRRHLMPNNESDPEYPDKMGQREDGRNIAKLWLESKKAAGMKALYAWHRDNLTTIDAADYDCIMGSFEPSHMKYVNDPPGAKTDDPSLAEMTEAAIKVLQKNDKGFFLFVEGAKIDIAMHDAWAKLALEEALGLDEAVQKAMDMTDEKETLIIVTADHSHGMTFGSYPTRGNPILGFTDHSSDRNPLVSDVDGLKYTTVSFANGPGFVGKYYVSGDEVVRVNLTEEEIADRKYRAATPVNAKFVGHEGGDVGIFARGPWSHLFHTTHEQNYIHHVMAYASCVGAYKDCAHTNTPPPPPTCGAEKHLYFSGIVFLSLVLKQLL